MGQSLFEGLPREWVSHHDQGQAEVCVKKNILFLTADLPKLIPRRSLLARGGVEWNGGGGMVSRVSGRRVATTATRRGQEGTEGRNKYSKRLTAAAIEDQGRGNEGGTEAPKSAWEGEDLFRAPYWTKGGEATIDTQWNGQWAAWLQTGRKARAHLKVKLGAKKEGRTAPARGVNGTGIVRDFPNEGQGAAKRNAPT